MKISVIGAAGMVGKEIVAEAKSRDHDVDSYTRRGRDGSLALEFSDTEVVAQIINSSDVTVISVASCDDYFAVVKAHQNLIATAPQGRIIVVGGAGALTAGDGKLFESPEFPEEYLPEARAFGEVLEATEVVKG